MKKCKTCGIAKPLIDFHKQGESKKTGKPWYRGRCKKCHNLKFQPPTGKPNSGRFKKGCAGNTKKGRTPWNKGIKYSPEEAYKCGDFSRGTGQLVGGWNHTQWRKAVFKRDGYKCQECLSGECLCAHHIKEWNGFPDLRFDVSNGLTVCKSCHGKIHGKKNCYILNDGVSWNKGLKKRR